MREIIGKVGDTSQPASCDACQLMHQHTPTTTGAMTTASRDVTEAFTNRNTMHTRKEITRIKRVDISSEN